MSDPWDTAETRRWTRRVRKDLVPKLEGSGAVISLVPRSGDGDIKFWVELGAMIMMNKPIILVLEQGQEIPPKLRLVADEVVVIDDWDDVSADSGPIRDAILRVLPKSDDHEQ
jgi:hypothetical protein